MIALDNQPISIVEDIGFTRLLNHISPKYEILAGSTFKKRYLRKFMKSSQIRFHYCWNIKIAFHSLQIFGVIHIQIIPTLV